MGSTLGQFVLMLHHIPGSVSVSNIRLKSKKEVTVYFIIVHPLPGTGHLEEVLSGNLSKAPASIYAIPQLKPSNSVPLTVVSNASYCHGL